MIKHQLKEEKHFKEIWNSSQKVEISALLQSGTICIVFLVNKQTFQPKSAPLKNLTEHSIVIIHKIYNSGFVTGWHNMPSFSSKKFRMIE